MFFWHVLIVAVICILSTSMLISINQRCLQGWFRLISVPPLQTPWATVAALPCRNHSLSGPLPVPDPDPFVCNRTIAPHWSWMLWPHVQWWRLNFCYRYMALCVRHTCCRSTVNHTVCNFLNWLPSLICLPIPYRCCQHGQRIFLMRWSCFLCFGRCVSSLCRCLLFDNCSLSRWNKIHPMSYLPAVCSWDISRW